MGEILFFPVLEDSGGNLAGIDYWKISYSLRFLMDFRPMRFALPVLSGVEG